MARPNGVMNQPRPAAFQRAIRQQMFREEEAFGELSFEELFGENLRCYLLTSRIILQVKHVIFSIILLGKERLWGGDLGNVRLQSGQSRCTGEEGPNGMFAAAAVSL